MESQWIEQIADEAALPLAGVTATVRLIKEGATVPFIARYRKEATGSLDEVAILLVRDRLTQLEELATRRSSIFKSLEERQLLTPELKAALEGARSLTALEDLYQPYRPKRRTRAMIARERGLEPLAQRLLEQQEGDPAQWATEFVDQEKEVGSVEDALAGARDILAEQVSDSAEARALVRTLYMEEGVLRSEVIVTREEEGAKFRDYFDWSEPLSKAPSHRILAIRRGEKDGFLVLRILPPEEKVIHALEKLFVAADNAAAGQVREAIADSYKRLLGPSMETEARMGSKKRADEEAVRVFAENLRELLLASPLGQKRVLAIDPGFRTGCKVVILSEQGNLLENGVIYPTLSGRQLAEAADQVSHWCGQYKIQAIAIGNGTAGRETEQFVRALKLPGSPTIVMVNESGASIYSASEIAREEFPDQDVTVRGAVSIGRRLMDPLAELVKIDPKSIGVGQYQHDVDQRLLKQTLDDVVISSVNRVGVELNTASRKLLSYVSGLNEQIAANIIDWRTENGRFASRKQLLKVARLGERTFQQAAGFLRINDGEHPLDGSAVHPEAYELVEQMATDVGCSVQELMGSASLRKKIVVENYISAQFGRPTIEDILKELEKPGRDPREAFEAFAFEESVHSLADLKVGMRLPGIVTNVTAFGAFVDVGVHQDGLVHVSQVSDSFVRDPAEVLKVGQKVQVTVLEVDEDRKRISLSMKTNPEKTARSVGERSTPRRDRGPRPDRKADAGQPFNNAFSSLGDALASRRN